MTTLLLIRHGESEANRQRVFAGQYDPELTDKGLKQAELTAHFVAHKYSVDLIYSSDLKRAYKTAQCLGQLLGLDVIKEPGMREINAGQWEKVKFVDLPVLYPAEFAVWNEHIGLSTCTGGESVRQLGDRILVTLERIAQANDGKTVAIGTHATPVRVAQSLIQTGGLDAMENIPWVANASVTEICYDNGKWNVVAVSQDNHLAEFRTSLPANV